MSPGSSEPRSAIADALAHLTRRDYSEAELAERLRGRGHPATEIEAAVERCRELGYLDDEAYAEGRLRALLQRRPSGPAALLQDLRRRGLAPTMSEQAVERILSDEGGERAVLERALRAWIDRHGEPADWRAARRCADHLSRRGFSAAVVSEALSPWLDDLAR